MLYTTCIYTNLSLYVCYWGVFQKRKFFTSNFEKRQKGEPGIPRHNLVTKQAAFYCDVFVHLKGHSSELATIVSNRSQLRLIRIRIILIFG